jgi:hypothetical protein
MFVALHLSCRRQASRQQREPYLGHERVTFVPRLSVDGSTAPEPCRGDQLETGGCHNGASHRRALSALGLVFVPVLLAFVGLRLVPVG